MKATSPQWAFPVDYKKKQKEASTAPRYVEEGLL